VSLRTMGRCDGLRSPETLAHRLLLALEISDQVLNSSLPYNYHFETAPPCAPWLLLLTLRVDISKHILSFGSNAAPYLFRGPLLELYGNERGIMMVVLTEEGLSRSWYLVNALDLRFCTTSIFS
jgi:hypothetical protein